MMLAYAPKACLKCGVTLGSIGKTRAGKALLLHNGNGCEFQGEFYEVDTFELFPINRPSPEPQGSIADDPAGGRVRGDRASNCTLCAKFPSAGLGE